MNKIAAEFWLGGLLLVVLALRLWGMYQGYPEFYGHVDEVGVAASIWNFFRAATLLPTEFTYPAFYSYLVAASMWCSYWLGAGPPGDNAMEGLVLLSYIDPAWVVLVSRSVSVVVSTLTLLVIFLLGKAINNSQTGLLLASSENEIEHTQASEATIRDADVAAEVTEFSRAQILLQAGNAMLSQANVNTVQALTLL